MHPQLGNPKLDLVHADQIRGGISLIESCPGQVWDFLTIPLRGILQAS